MSDFPPRRPYPAHLLREDHEERLNPDGRGFYIYAIGDPRNQEEFEAVFVGMAHRPWEAVLRHLNNSHNEAVRIWAEGIQEDFPEGLELWTDSVCRYWHHQIDEQDLEIGGAGRTRLPWIILDQADEAWEDGPRENAKVFTRSVVNQWVDRLTESGHTVFNRRRGRPRKSAI